MELLIAVVQVLSRYRIKQIDILGNPDSDSRFTELYKMLESEEIKDDKEAARHFYGPSAKPTDDRYRTFKKEFRERLLNTVFFIDYESPQFTDSQRAYYFAQREMGAIRILFARFLGQFAYPMAEALLEICKKMEFTDLCVLLLEKLKETHPVYFGDKKKYGVLKQDFWHYKALWDAELLAKEATEELKLETSKTAVYHPGHVLMTREKLEALLPLKEKYESVTFCFHFYTVKDGVCTAARDYAGKIDVYNEAITYFRQKPFDVRSYTAVFLSAKALIQLTLQQYEPCKASLDEALEIIEKGNINWFTAMERKVVLGFHTQDYGYAYAAYAEARAQKEFKRLKGSGLEIWKILEAWIYRAFLLNKLPDLTPEAAESIKQFKYAKFANDLPAYEADKKGKNIRFLIVKIALSIALKERREALRENIEAIRKYNDRNLPADEPPRLRDRLFMKLLLEIPKCDFNTANLEIHAAPALKMLTEAPPDFVDSGYQSEIVPYEILWKELIAGVV